MNGLLPNTLDEEVICAMRAAGFRTLNLSLGSTSGDQLRRFRRPNVTEAFDQVLELAEKYGLQAVGYLIAGAPGQDPDTSLADLLHLASRRVLVGLSIYYPAPGSSDFEKCACEPASTAVRAVAFQRRPHFGHHHAGGIHHPAPARAAAEFHEAAGGPRIEQAAAGALYGRRFPGGRRQNGNRADAAKMVSS